MSREVPNTRLWMAFEMAWFAVSVRPGDEARSQVILSRLGLWVFLPRVSAWRRNNKFRRGKVLKSYPLMARYLIVGADDPQRIWKALFRSGRIRGVICADGRPYRFAPAIVEALNARAEAGEFRAPDHQRFMATHGEFEAGDAAYLVAPGYDGRRVTVAEIVGDRARVALSFFNRDKLVDVPLDALVNAA